MTCIASVVHDGRVYMGGDSAGVSGWDLTLRADEKVFSVGEFVIGFTSSFRMGQLLRHSFAPPPISGDIARYMVVEFVDAVRACLKAGGYAKKESDVESAGTFMVGVRGRLFTVSDDYQVGEASAGYDAIGCGHAYAKGALNATRRSPPRSRLNAALAAAEAHSAGVRGPYVIVEGPDS